MFTRCARPINALHSPSYYARTYWEVHSLKLFARADTREYSRVRTSFYAYVRALITHHTRVNRTPHARIC